MTVKSKKQLAKRAKAKKKYDHPQAKCLRCDAVQETSRCAWDRVKQPRCTYCGGPMERLYIIRRAQRNKKRLEEKYGTS